MNEKMKASLIKIQEEARAHRLGAMGSYGGCVYEAEDGKHCAIGCLIHPEKLKEIKAANMNGGTTADQIFREFPEIKEMTGFNDDQALTLQNWHDKTYSDSATITESAFLRMLDGLINGWLKEIPRNPDPFISSSVNKVSFE